MTNWADFARVTIVLQGIRARVAECVTTSGRELLVEEAVRRFAPRYELLSASSTSFRRLGGPALRSQRRDARGVPFHPCSSLRLSLPGKRIRSSGDPPYSARAIEDGRRRSRHTSSTGSNRSADVSCAGALSASADRGSRRRGGRCDIASASASQDRSRPRRCASVSARIVAPASSGSAAVGARRR